MNEKMQRTEINWFESEMHTTLSTYTVNNEKTLFRKDRTNQDVYVDAHGNSWVKGIAAKARYRAAIETIIHYAPESESVQIPHFAETISDLRSLMFSVTNRPNYPLLMDGNTLMWIGHDSVYSTPFPVPALAEIARGHWAGIHGGLAEVFVRMVAFGLDGSLVPEIRASVCGEDVFTFEVQLKGLSGYSVTLRIPRAELFAEWVDMPALYAEMLRPMPTVARVQASSLRHAFKRARTAGEDSCKRGGYSIPDYSQRFFELVFAPDSALVVRPFYAVGGRRMESEAEFMVKTLATEGRHGPAFVSQSILEAFVDDVDGNDRVLLATDAQRKVLQISVRSEATLTMLAAEVVDY